jgi:serine/threonine-protein kinase PpkA
MKRIRTLGKGGLGIVSLYQANSGQNFAIKQMLYQWDEKHYERFKREVEMMANLVHENIVNFLYFDILNSNPWYLMPFYEDGSLRDKLMDIKSKGQIYSVKGATGIIYQLAKALHHAHEFGIIHRDIKPENILFRGKEFVITDWCIGKFIHKESKVLTNVGLDTKSYCSPEQWESGLSDSRSDIYSLGLVYRELLTGSLTGQIQERRINDIVNKMTATSLANRYQTMSEVIEAIRTLNEISTSYPMKDFWEGDITSTAVDGIEIILDKLTENK